jgi:epoxyqueuosine reductase
MSSSNPSLETALKAEAKRLGFAACGITGADQNFAPGLDRWLEAGMHGDMAWMEARKDQRAGPQALWPEARSVIALGMSYAPHRRPGEGRGLFADMAPNFGQAPASAGATAQDRGQISVYAQGADYHDVVKKALKALARWLIDQAGGDLKVFVDTAPVMEKPLSANAGIGWQGKHSNLVSPDHGSWLFLGAIMTNVELAPDAPQRDQCGSCTACQTACPTDAFPAPYQVDARRCISYLTIEHKGPIPDEFRRAIGNRIYGCDDCLAVCPWNKFADAAAANRAFVGRAELAAPALGDLLCLDDASFRQVFAGSPIKRIGRDRMVRNAAIAAGNSGSAALVPPLQALLDDPSDVVRDAAQWALGELGVSD